MPAAISTFVLPKIGERYGRRYFLTGEIFAAVDAKEIGLVHEVVPPGDLEGTADSICAAIAANGPRAVRAALAIIRRSRELPLAQALDEEEQHAVDLILTGECLHGIGAFLTGKAPVFPDN